MTNGEGSITTSVLLLVAFIVLKLVGVIDRTRRWVLSPLRISLLIGLILLLVAFIVAKRNKL